MPNFTEVLVQQRTAPSSFPKKRRECYCGNLTSGVVDHQVLHDAFIRLFKALPMFSECYPDVDDPVRHVAFPNGQNGMFAFVEFHDEVLAATAVLFSGFELCGRPVKVGRPQGYAPAPYGELPPLDVEVLRASGILPTQPDLVIPSVKNSVSTKSRELYFGNLLSGKITEETMTEFLAPICMELPEYDPARGPPVIKVTVAQSGTFAFVQFQNADMASRLIPVLDDTMLFGRRLKVGRPSNYDPRLEEAAQAQVLPALPAPPLPVAESEAWLAGAAAASDLTII